MAKTIIHVSDGEAASDFASLLARVRAGADVIIEHNATPVAIVQPAKAAPRTSEGGIALLPADSRATIDAGFARDVAAAVESHPESLTPQSWD